MIYKVIFSIGINFQPTVLLSHNFEASLVLNVTDQKFLSFLLCNVEGQNVKALLLKLIGKSISVERTQLTNHKWVFALAVQQANEIILFSR